jgi:predicted aspartyl protease
MDGNHLIVTCTLHDQGNVIKYHTLIDCGTTGYAFIDEDYARCHNIPLHLLKSPRNLTVINGRPVTSRAITHITHTHLVIWNHQEDILHFETKFRNYPIVLGISWLQRHDVCLHFAQNKIMFNSNYCLSHCLDDALHVQVTTQDTPSLHLDSIARPLGHTVLDAQETRKVIPPEYHDFLRLFLDEGL